MKTILITGAGSGIGEQTALSLAEKGVQLILCGRRADRLADCAAACSARGADVRVVAVDVRDRTAMCEALSAFPHISGIVASSGICARTELHRDDSDATFDDVMLTNVQGVWNTFRAVHDRLEDGARCVVVSSGLGKLARPGYAAYTASKHAVLGIMKCLALELAPRGIRVNAVCPGWVDTEMAMADLDYSAAEHGTTRAVEFASAVAAIPMKRFVKPGEVAQLIVWLMSDASAAITAQSWNISCGEFFV